MNAAPNGWFEALAEKAPNDVFMTWSWDEDTDYSVAGLADGDGEIMIEESHDEDDLRRVIAGGRGLVGRAAISRDEEDYEPS